MERVAEHLADMAAEINPWTLGFNERNEVLRSFESKVYLPVDFTAYGVFIQDFIVICCVPPEVTQNGAQQPKLGCLLTLGVRSGAYVGEGFSQCHGVMTSEIGLPA